VIEDYNRRKKGMKLNDIVQYLRQDKEILFSQRWVKKGFLILKTLSLKDRYLYNFMIVSSSSFEIKDKVININKDLFLVISSELLLKIEESQKKLQISLNMDKRIKMGCISSFNIQIADVFMKIIEELQDTEALHFRRGTNKVTKSFAYRDMHETKIDKLRRFVWEDSAEFQLWVY